MSTAIIRGDASNHEIWESGTRVNGADRRTVEYVLTGGYEALRAAMPKAGDAYRGRDVVSATLAPRRGGRGRLSIVCAVPKSAASGQGEDGAGELVSVVEVDMAQEELDVRTLLGAESYSRDLAAWEGAEPGLKRDFKFVNANGGVEELHGNALSVAKLILAGISAVLRFHPVVTRTTYLDSEPQRLSVAGLGAVGSEPAVAPAGYEYLKTGDHWTQARDGSWTRVEQWTGAKTWNGSLYRGGSGTPIDPNLLEELP